MSFDSIKPAEKKTPEYNVRSSMANVNFTKNNAMAGILYVCFKSIINILKKFFQIEKFSILKDISIIFSLHCIYDKENNLQHLLSKVN